MFCPLSFFFNVLYLLQRVDDDLKKLNICESILFFATNKESRINRNNIRI